MAGFHDLIHVALIGTGATAVLDAWLVLARRIGMPSGSFGLVGRWVGHFAHGRFAHESIARARPLAHELGLGWLVHYAVGVGFAGLLVAVQGMAWARQPTPGPALVLGVATVVMPLCVMQPAMGAGFAGSKTPAPWRTVLRSLVNHAVFGLGLYLAAVAVAAIAA